MTIFKSEFGIKEIILRNETQQGFEQFANGFFSNKKDIEKRVTANIICYYDNTTQIPLTEMIYRTGQSSFIYDNIKYWIE